MDAVVTPSAFRGSSVWGPPSAPSQGARPQLSGNQGGKALFCSALSGVVPGEVGAQGPGEGMVNVLALGLQGGLEGTVLPVKVLPLPPREQCQSPSRTLRSWVSPRPGVPRRPWAPPGAVASPEDGAPTKQRLIRLSRPPE